MKVDAIQIYDNSFGVSLLENTIDEEAFADLCTLIEKTAAANASETMVDKKLAHFLVELLQIFRYKIASPELFDEGEIAKLNAMVEQFTRLVLEKCFVQQVD